MVFIYDANGVPLGLKYRNSTYAQSVWDSYWYERNLQGDIVAIYNDCSHFVADVMKAGHSDNDVTEAVHNNTRSTVPLITHLLTSAANFIGDKYRELKERMGW